MVVASEGFEEGSRGLIPRRGRGVATIGAFRWALVLWR